MTAAATLMMTTLMTTVLISVMVDSDVDHQAKEEESREKIANNLEEEKSKEVQGMVNRLTFLLTMTSELISRYVEIIAIMDNGYCNQVLEPSPHCRHHPQKKREFFNFLLYNDDKGHDN